MSALFRRVSTAAAIGGAAVLVFGIVCFMAGARVNTSRSIPLGLYWASSAPVEKGRYVMFCPPKLAIFDAARQRGYIGAGFCPGGYGYMMKRVLASTNDAVRIADDGVQVNGQMLPFTVPVKVDAQGRSLPRYHEDSFTLTEYQVLLMADTNPQSFDARYFGPVQRSSIKSVIEPVLTW